MTDPYASSTGVTGTHKPTLTEKIKLKVEEVKDQVPGHRAATARAGTPAGYHGGTATTGTEYGAAHTGTGYGTGTGTGTGTHTGTGLGTGTGTGTHTGTGLGTGTGRHTGTGHSTGTTATDAAYPAAAGTGTGYAQPMGITDRIKAAVSPGTNASTPTVSQPTSGTGPTGTTHTGTGYPSHMSVTDRIKAAVVPGTTHNSPSMPTTAGTTLPSTYGTNTGATAGTTNTGATAGTASGLSTTDKIKNMLPGHHGSTTGSGYN